jgi:hypothetical protein
LTSRGMALAKSPACCLCSFSVRLLQIVDRTS